MLNGLAINDLSNLTESAKAYLINSGDPVTEGSIAISGTDITVTLTLGGSTVTYTGTTSATGTEVEGSASYTPAGSVTVNSTTSYLTGSFSGTQGNISVQGTPSGTVTKPTFTGTQGTVTVT